MKESGVEVEILPQKASDGDEDIVEFLQTIMKMVREGEIKSIALVCLHHNENFSHGYSNFYYDPLKLISVIDFLKKDLLKRYEAE